MSAQTTTAAHVAGSAERPGGVGLAARLLRDPRDVPHLRVLVQATCMIPAAAYLFYRGDFPWWAGTAYLLVWFFAFGDRYTTMTHVTTHSVVFNRRFDFLNTLTSWVLGPFFGQTPGTFFVHHIGMHHVEDNGARDLSSTMPYRRDSFLHWLRYFLRFLIIGPFELTVYLIRNKRKKLAWRLWAGEVFAYSLYAALLYVRPVATLLVFVVPFFLNRFFMMAGNFAQHIFIDPTDPADPLKNSITCVTRRYNDRCFGDGYHALHHMQPKLHFSELAGVYERTREAYGKADAVVFDGLDFVQVWVLTLAHRYEALARRFVRLPGAPARTDEEVAALLRSRVAPILQPASRAASRRERGRRSARVSHAV